MRQVAAALLDSLAATLLAFLGFRLALLAAPCGNHPGNCLILSPLVILFVVLAVAGYVAIPYRVCQKTLGQYLVGARTPRGRS